MSPFASLIEVAETRARQRPNDEAYSFLNDGEDERVEITYGSLAATARAIGSELARQCRPRSRVLLLYAPGLDYIIGFFGAVYAGMVPVPAYPPVLSRLNRSLQRLRAIATDCEPACVLATAAICDLAASLGANAPELQSVQWIATDTIGSDLASSWRDPRLLSTDLAFLQYTSGSTGAPKGVMLTQGNLLTMLKMLTDADPYSRRYVGWLPPYHDMGLIGQLLQPFYAGYPCLTMPPLHFLQAPSRWLKAISNYRGTTTAAPNFAFDLCVRKITPEVRAGLDLSSWIIAYNGSEQVRSKSLEEFAAAFGPVGFRPTTFYPCYGLAEATLIVTGGLHSDPPKYLSVDRMRLGAGVVADASTPAVATKCVSCGRAPAGQRVLVVDPMRLVPMGARQIGEVWVAGPNVAKGYWGRPELSRQVFEAKLADGSGAFLRTGDLGFIDDAGDLFLTGRLRDLIKIRGRNIYPEDVERAVESCRFIRLGCVAAFSVATDEGEALAVAAEVEDPQRIRGTSRALDADVRPRIPPADDSFDFVAVVKQIRKVIAEETDVRASVVLLLKAGTIPKTSSGKLQRYACREGFLNQNLNLVGQG